MKKYHSFLKLYGLTFFVSIAITFTACNERPKDLKQVLQELSETIVKPIESDTLYSESYEVHFTQLIDHENKKSGTFTQKVFVNHIDYESPTVVILEGYTAKKNYTSELSELLNANQIIIEHRFFGDSRPDSIPWKYLTIKQAASDHHAIIQALKKIYKGKWVSTGISKGGQTTIFHRRFFPNDVDVSVPYVAPLNLAREDIRINAHFSMVGSEECRKKVKAFQKLLFENKEHILPILKEYTIEKNIDFKPIDIKRAYDLNVLEYAFAFWQWSGNCESIPDDNSTLQQWFDHWKKVSPFSFFAHDKSGTDLAFTYQALYEIGFYNYDITDFNEYLSDTLPITFDFKLPEYMKIDFRPEVMRDINNWVQDSGNYMLYISGEYDPWGATAINPSSHTIAVKMVNPGGNHRTRINSFPKEMKDNIYNLLESWLEVEIQKETKCGGVNKENVLEIL